MRLFLACICFVLLAGSSVAQHEESVKRLDDYFDKAYQLHELPGMSVAIVKDGKVLLSKGYGYRSIESKEKMTDESLFNIASCSKAFTAACIAVLVEEGKLSWEDKIVDHIPNFKLADPWITQEMNLRDMLAHRSGLGTFYGDLLWYETDYTPTQIIDRMRHLPLTNEFRTQFGYQNNMFIVAGQIVQKVTGEPWEKFVAKRFFNPLDMDETQASGSEVDDDQEIALPHLNGKLQPREKHLPNPAASIWSSASELSQWMMLLLDSGRADGNTLISPEAIHHLMQPHTLTQVSPWQEQMGIHFRAYGLGWSMFDLHGKKVVEHSGGMPGYISRVALVPEENLGIVILTNDMNYLPSALVYYTMDEFFNDGKHANDWATIYHSFKVQGAAMDEAAEKARQDARIAKTKPSLDLEKYVGTYRDEMYGDATVELKDGKLVFTMLPSREKFTATMEHWHFDTWKVVLKDQFLPPGYVTFEFDTDRNITHLKIDLPNPDFHFFNLDFKPVPAEE